MVTTWPADSGSNQRRRVTDVSESWRLEYPLVRSVPVAPQTGTAVASGTCRREGRRPLVHRGP
ncbi:hypothetical protein GCM10023329_00340 [Streptomyces sanyensis]|uniref:Uncharacterized protein n=1 Tax=Streptomyces sanyensis TaxID=568869 RepID=A0ABP8ZL55_9ACTN